MKTRSTDEDDGLSMIKDLMTQITQKQNTQKQINLVAFVDDPGCDKHKMIEPSHQESEKRTQIIRKAIQKYQLDKFMIRSGSIDLTKSDMFRVHNKEYIEQLIYFGRTNKPVTVPEPSTDLTMSSIDSLEGIFAAASSVMGGVDTVCGKIVIDKTFHNNKYSYTTKRVRKVFCNVRPPGHHAHINHGAGFCFMNNVAIGAKFALDKYNSFIKRVLIFDWDLHHGDGTEDIFKDDPNVMYVSFHRGGPNDEFYPFTGTGTTQINDLSYQNKNIHNFSIGPNESADSYMTKFRNEFMPLAKAFDPDLVFISCGFDSHKDDHYHALPLDYCHFQEMTKHLCRLADECATGRLVSVLEGGYTPNILYRCAIIHMLTMVNGY